MGRCRNHPNRIKKKKMAKENPVKKPKFNSYWIYGIVVVGLLTFSMFGDGSSQTLKKTNISTTTIPYIQ